MTGNRMWRVLSAIIVSSIYLVFLLTFLSPMRDGSAEPGSVRHLADGSWQAESGGLGYEQMRRVVGRPFKFMTVVNGRSTLSDKKEGVGIQILSNDSFLNVDIETGLSLGGRVMTYTFADISPHEIGLTAALAVAAIIFGVFMCLVFRPKRVATVLGRSLNWGIRVLVIGGIATIVDAVLLGNAPPIRTALTIVGSICLACAGIALIARLLVPEDWMKESQSDISSANVSLSPKGFTPKNSMLYALCIISITLTTLFINNHNRVANTPAGVDVRCFGWPNTWLVRIEFVYHSRSNEKLVKEERQVQWQILSAAQAGLSIGVSLFAATLLMVPIITIARRRKRLQND